MTGKEARKITTVHDFASIRSDTNNLIMISRSNIHDKTSYSQNKGNSVIKNLIRSHTNEIIDTDIGSSMGNVFGSDTMKKDGFIQKKKKKIRKSQQKKSMIQFPSGVCDLDR